MSNNAPIVMSHPSLDWGKSLALHLQEKTDPAHLFSIIKWVMSDEEVKCVQHLNETKWIVTRSTSLARDKLFGATIKHSDIMNKETKWFNNENITPFKYQ